MTATTDETTVAKVVVTKVLVTAEARRVSRRTASGAYRALQRNHSKSPAKVQRDDK
jgi:hypothetical protein